MINLDKDTFSQEVLEEKGLVLVDFWSENCENCKALIPHIEELAKIYEEDIKFTKLNTKGNTRLAIKQKVLGLPTVTIYKDGLKVVEITKDDVTKEVIQKMIEGLL